jgi:hypothetical protein
VGANNIGFLAGYTNGRFNVYVDGYSANSPLQPWQGFFAYSKVNGSWLPAGTDYAGGQTVTLHPGWNLVGNPYPPQGLTTDVIYQQITQAGGTVQEIAIYGPGGYQTWVPGAGQTPFLVPSWAGVWILLGPSVTPVTWTPH